MQLATLVLRRDRLLYHRPGRPWFRRRTGAGIEQASLPSQLPLRAQSKRNTPHRLHRRSLQPMAAVQDQEVSCVW